jgi:hypothetical protein
MYQKLQLAEFSILALFSSSAILSGFSDYCMLDYRNFVVVEYSAVQYRRAGTAVTLAP